MGHKNVFKIGRYKVNFIGTRSYINKKDKIMPCKTKLLKWDHYMFYEEIHEEVKGNY